MELQQIDNMYKCQYDIDANNMSNNRLHCTFTDLEGIDSLVNDINSLYNILYNKIFVLFIKSTNEYVITYNIENGNFDSIPNNTILLHSFNIILVLLPLQLI